MHGETLTRFFQTAEFKAPDRGGPRLFVISGPGTGTTYAIEAGESSLGRLPGNTFVLAGPGVSKKHCVVALDDSGAVSVEDAGSRNGTEVNNRALRAGQRLQLSHGDTVRVCGSVMLFTQPPRADEETTIEIDTTSAAAEAADALDSYADLKELRQKRR
ncbi:MAG: FHA domain-containing protein [Planctomycetota bacterium]|jgi:pSer/pThr/pTyr-binding forkhead associated (FHA) protein